MSRLQNFALVNCGLVVAFCLAGCRSVDRWEAHTVKVDRGQAAAKKLPDPQQTSQTDVVPDGVVQAGYYQNDSSTAENVVAAEPIRDSVLSTPLPPAGAPSQQIGQPEVIVDDTYTLDELQQLAMSRNPTIQQAYGLVQQARGNWLQVGLYPNPILSYDGQGNNGLFDAQGATVSQTFVTANKLRLNRAVASLDIQRASWDMQAQSLRVINEIQIRYALALGAQRQVATIKELLKVAQEGVQTSEKLLEGEEVGRSDVLQSRLQLNQTQLQLRNAEYRVAATWKQLGNVVGVPDLPVTRLEGGLEDEIPNIDVDLAWQQLQNSPVLMASRARSSAAAVQVQREQVQRYPDLKIGGGLWNDSVRPPNALMAVNVGIEVPIFDRNQGNVSAAVGELRAAQAETERLELTLRDRLAEVYQRYESARNQGTTYRDTILPTAEENLSIALRAYEAGELDFLRVLTARRDLFEARMNYISALTDLRVSAVEIEGMLLTGGLDSVYTSPTASNSSGQNSGIGN